MKSLDAVRRVMVALVAVGVLVAAVVLLGSSGAANHLTPTTQVVTHLTTATSVVKTATAGQPTNSLPPSHDNDAGHARIVDLTPDADVDWYQSHR